MEEDDVIKPKCHGSSAKNIDAACDLSSSPQKVAENDSNTVAQAEDDHLKLSASTRKRIILRSGEPIKLLKENVICKNIPQDLHSTWQLNRVRNDKEVQVTPGKTDFGKIHKN